MRSVTVRTADLKNIIINLGFVGENEHRQIRFDAKKDFEEYPHASASLTVVPPEGESYPAIIERDGDYVLWTITDSDVIGEGDGEIQLAFTEGEVVKRTCIGRTKTDRSLVPTGSIPSGIDDFITRAGTLLEQVEDTFPAGGTTGQVLAKKSAADYDTEWVDQGAGGTEDYDELENRPQIGGVTLTGNKTLHDLGAASEGDVDAKYTKPAGGIPASDIADGVIPDPEDLIDDTAGEGDTDKVWSADKSHELLTEITQTADDVDDLNEAVFTSAQQEIVAPNLFESVTDTDVQLGIGSINDYTATSFTSTDVGYGFVVNVADYRGKELMIQRTNTGTLRGVFSVDYPAVGVSFNHKWEKWDGYSVARIVEVPSDANYLFVQYYNSNTDTNTKAQCIAGMKIAQMNEDNLFDQASDDCLLAFSSGTFTTATLLYGFYVPVDNSNGEKIVIQRDIAGTRFRCAFTENIPAAGVSYTGYTDSARDDKTVIYTTIPNGAKYLYLAYYRTADTKTQEQLKAGMNIRYFVPDKITIDSGKNSRIEELKNELTIKGSDDLMKSKSGRMLLSLGSTSFGTSTTLYGFYVPIDPNKGTTVTVRRKNAGKRFRVVSCTNVPANGTSYTSGKVMQNDTSRSIVYDKIVSADRYLYVAYYSTEQDSLTEEELLTGLTIIYGTDNDYKADEPRLDRFDYPHNVDFVNGNINSKGAVVQSSKHIVSDSVRNYGRFAISCPSDYVATIHEYDFNGNYIFSFSVTNDVKSAYHWGLIRVCISASDNSDVTPTTVDFSKIKMPWNRFSAEEFTEKSTFVLDAENCTTEQLYAYYDAAVAKHGMYASKTLLCTEESGLPVYYYTLGSGSTKICIVTGQHGPGQGGDPRDSVITVAKMVNDLIEGNFEQGSVLQKLHDDCTLMVFPVLNPYGFNKFSRYNADSVDTNRDWEDKETTAVYNAEPVISTFDADIIFDVHCNGTTPIDEVDVEMQFNFGDDGATFKSAAEDYFKSYYNMELKARSFESTTNPEKTLCYYILETSNKIGGLMELRWWMKASKEMHDKQVESANYAMVVNAIKYMLSKLENVQYVFEKTPNQNQY